jgi:hypothetical protein
MSPTAYVFCFHSTLKEFDCIVGVIESPIDTERTRFPVKSSTEKTIEKTKKQMAVTVKSKLKQCLTFDAVFFIPNTTKT